ncbi:MAG: hypothetical protein RIQ81_1289 [Pseudomonadota bacterium]|jgi:hypothetical protein
MVHAWTAEGFSMVAGFKPAFIFKASALYLMISAFLMLAGCRQAAPSVGQLRSGAPNVWDFEWSCAGMQHNFVNFGNKFEAARADFIRLEPKLNRAPTVPVGESLKSYRGVTLDRAYSGQLGTIVMQVGDVPGLVSRESDCLSLTASDEAYDACVEMARHFKTLWTIASAWDQNKNGQKCFEGFTFQKTEVVEFAYCDNECAFNSLTCTRCEVPSNESGNPRAFVCKSPRTAIEAVGAFCRLKDGMCGAFQPESMCQSKPGLEFAGGPALRTLDGKQEIRKSYELSGYLGARETVKVKTGVVAGKSVSARGTLKGRIGYVAHVVGSDLFTRTGIATPGTRVQCTLTLSKIADLSFAGEFGVGGDFVLANGEAVVEAGGAFNFTKEFQKTSATWSVGGQTEEMILSQCMHNFVRRWIAVELTKYLDEYPGLEIVKKAMHRVIADTGFDAQVRIPDTSAVACRYSEYSPAYLRTAGVVLYMSEPMTLQWGTLRHAAGIDNLWPDGWSEKVPFDLEALRPYVRELKDGTLRGDRLRDFFNGIVVPASRLVSDPNWRLADCI